MLWLPDLLSHGMLLFSLANFMPKCLVIVK